jgi:hypothetical protein
MPLDSRNKRASALGIGLAALVVLPAPDGTVVQADRQQVAYCYAGISAQALVEYDVMVLTNVVLTAATLTNVTLSAATLTNVTLEPD